MRTLLGYQLLWRGFPLCGLIVRGAHRGQCSRMQPWGCCDLPNHTVTNKGGVTHCRPCCLLDSTKHSLSNTFANVLFFEFADIVALYLRHFVGVGCVHSSQLCVAVMEGVRHRFPFGREASPESSMASGSHAAEVGSVMSLVLDARKPVATFANLIVERHQGGPTARTLRKRAHEQLYELPKTATPYGHILEGTKIIGKCGELVWQHINIFAFWWHTASESKDFFDLMKSCVQCSRWMLESVVVHRRSGAPKQASS